MSADATRRGALAELARAAGRKRATAAPPAAPSHLRARAVSPALVSLAWSAEHLHHARHSAHRPHQRPPALVYEVLRDGRLLARTSRPRFADHHVMAQHRYRYAVRVRIGHQLGRRTKWISVLTPPAPKPKPTVAVQATPPPAPPAMSTAMVERLFWRAGFGATDLDRSAWTGQPGSALVDHFLTTSYALNPTTTPPTNSGQPINPLASDQELQMEWLDRMQRVTNPLVERLNLFWHRHWAVSRDAGVPSGMLLAYRDRLRRYSDLGANPTASFHDLALEMTTQDAAMSLYLTGFLNQKSAPNENYAREFMELFTLGVTNAAGQPNYTQSDVHNLARAFTGFALNYNAGTVSFVPGHHDVQGKTILGQTGNYDAPAAVAIVLSHPNHAPFLVTKLWNEFIRTPIPAGALAWLCEVYTSSGFQIAPLVRGILTHPLIYESIDEPNLVKPPVVYAIGVLRALGAPLRDRVQTDALGSMQQQPYHPPNVAGWEGNLAWLNTTTSVARFNFVVRCQNLLPAIQDIATETVQQAYDRAHAMAGRPWLAPASQLQLLRYASQAPVSTAAKRRERILALVAFMLGGPDGQVM